MTTHIAKQLPGFMDALGLEEEPMGLIFSNTQPQQGYAPKPLDLPTKEKEQRNEIDWHSVFADFSCALGHIWRARRKKTLAWFSAERFGCAGAAFWMGFNKPQTECIINYVSSGIPGFCQGERYCASPDALRQVFAEVDPEPAPKPYCVVKPLPQFQEHETPELVVFFTRPEPLCGLHQLAFYVTNDPNVVISPWSSACGSIVAWPMRYLVHGEQRAVLGGWDPSARKFFKPDELSFTIPYSMFTAMLDSWQESFLTTKEWSVVRKKIARSKEAWS